MVTGLGRGGGRGGVGAATRIADWLYFEEEDVV